MGKGYLSGSPFQVEEVRRKIAIEKSVSAPYQPINCSYRRDGRCTRPGVPQKTDCFYWKCDLYTPPPQPEKPAPWYLRKHKCIHMSRSKHWCKLKKCSGTCTLEVRAACLDFLPVLIKISVLSWRFTPLECSLIRPNYLEGEMG